MLRLLRKLKDCRNRLIAPPVPALFDRAAAAIVRRMCTLPISLPDNPLSAKWRPFFFFSLLGYMNLEAPYLLCPAPASFLLPTKLWRAEGGVERGRELRLRDGLRLILPSMTTSIIACMKPESPPNEARNPWTREASRAQHAHPGSFPMKSVDDDFH